MTKKELTIIIKEFAQVTPLTPEKKCKGFKWEKVIVFNLTNGGKVEYSLYYENITLNQGLAVISNKRTTEPVAWFPISNVASVTTYSKQNFDV